MLEPKMSKLPFRSPFSFLNQSLLLSDEIQNLLSSTDIKCDEYGFKLPPSTIESKMNEMNDEEKEYYLVKSKWIAFLENEYKKLAPSSCLDMLQFDGDITRSPCLDDLICLSIPNDLRPFFWIRFSKALHLKINSKWAFPQLIDLSSNEKSLTLQQVSLVLPNNLCFNQPKSICSTRLRRILRAVKWYHKTHLNEEDGEGQLNLSLIGAHLLLICSEEDAFWLLLKISLSLNISDCIEIISQIMEKCCPIVNGLLQRHDIEFKLIASIWFSSLFACFLQNAKLLYTLWDLYFYEGPIFLIQITIGLLIVETKSLESCLDSKEFFNNLSDLPMNSFQSLKKIIHAWKSGKNIVSNLNLPSYLYNYEPQNNTDVLLLNPGSCDELKMKNVKQTGLIMRLHDAIVAIAHHFQAYNFDSKYNLEPDYDSIDKVDTKQDLMNRLRPYRRRAKALIDFPNDDDDELCFKKNDIITIINEKDEHCWIGELRGRVGWFPAKFVEVLDERGQDYCIAGDDRVVPFINDLIRGKLSLALKAILTYDMKKSFFFTIHPWTIIEEISNLSTNADLKSVYSRLVLTKTFRLDEYDQVLSPNDLLFRSICLINSTHRDCPMDIKLRSLICLGLNQYVLHDWFELICISQPSVIAKSYGPNSFLTTPAWKLIKAELKLLVQFSFYLNPNAEIESSATNYNNNNNNANGNNGRNAGTTSIAAAIAATNNEPNSPVTKEGVCDMLVKYHLFSWDI